jgi:hypothetical protein
MVIGWITASVPPTMTTSARPSLIMSTPSAIDSLLDAQAEMVVWTPARALIFRLMLAAAALPISIGTASGLTRRTPLSRSVSQLPSSDVSPPIPVPTATPMRSGSIGLSSSKTYPASVQACSAAISAS